MEDGTRESIYMFVFIIQDTCTEDKFLIPIFISTIAFLFVFTSFISALLRCSVNVPSYLSIDR